MFNRDLEPCFGTEHTTKEAYLLGQEANQEATIKTYSGVIQYLPMGGGDVKISYYKIKTTATIRSDYALGK